MSRMRVLFLLGFGALVATAALGSTSSIVRADDQVAVPATDLLESVSLDPAALLGGDELGPDQRGPGGGLRPGPRPNLCLRLSAAVRLACPCNGPNGAGWDNHEAYVECVSTTLDVLLANNDNVRLDECAAKIIERATASEVGNEGFQCPMPRELQPKPRDPSHPRPPHDPSDPHPTGMPRHPHPTPEPTAVP